MLQRLDVMLFVTLVAISYAVNPADIMIDSEDSVDSKEVRNSIPGTGNHYQSMQR